MEKTARQDGSASAETGLPLQSRRCGQSPIGEIETWGHEARHQDLLRIQRTGGLPDPGGHQHLRGELNIGLTDNLVTLPDGRTFVSNFVGGISVIDASGGSAAFPLGR